VPLVAVQRIVGTELDLAQGVGSDGGNVGLLGQGLDHAQGFPLVAHDRIGGLKFIGIHGGGADRRRIAADL